MLPQVSVLMPNYNCEKYLPEAIDSILSQSFVDFEFIIIDDGSTDNSWQIIQDYVKKDKRIIAVKNNKNYWISYNRNKLLSLSKWEYIVWQDSDDISIIDRIEKQKNLLEKNKEIWICWWWMQFFDETWNTTKRLYCEDDIWVRKTIFRYSPISQWASMYRKIAINEAWGYDKGLNIAEDLNLSFKIWRNYKFANLRDITLLYRQYPSSTTHSKLKEMELATLKVRNNHHKSKYYQMTFWDKLYNIAQFISIYIMPPVLKIKIFNLIRNSK